MAPDRLRDAGAALSDCRSLSASSGRRSWLDCKPTPSMKVTNPTYIKLKPGGNARRFRTLLLERG